MNNDLYNYDGEPVIDVFRYNEHCTQAEALAQAIFTAVTEYDKYPWCIYSTLNNSYVVQPYKEPRRGFYIADYSDCSRWGMTGAYSLEPWKQLMMLTATLTASAQSGMIADKMDELRMAPQIKHEVDTLRKCLKECLYEWRNDRNTWKITYCPEARWFIIPEKEIPGFITGEHFDKWYAKVTKKPATLDQLVTDYMTYLINECADWWNVNMKVRRDANAPLGVFLHSDEDVAKWKKKLDKVNEEDQISE